MKEIILQLNSTLKPFTSDLWPHQPIYLYGLWILTFLLAVALIIVRVRKSVKTTDKNINASRTAKDYKVNAGDAFKNALKKTRTSIIAKLDPFLGGKLRADDNFYNELEEMLICADVGIGTTSRLIEKLKSDSDAPKETDAKIEMLKQLLNEIIISANSSLKTNDSGPTITMVVGVNGVGKTTTIGKITSQIKKSTPGIEPGEIVLAAADTFRAAAIEQLSIWAERNDVKVIKHKDGADPSAVVYDAVKHALARENTKHVIIDTAGRLHTKKNLMEELKKIKRTVKKLVPEAPHEILLVLDATTGQNALQQARIFHEALNVDAVAITKLDGTAKGGILIQIADELKIPIKYAGLGEGIEDLRSFEPDFFTDSLFC